MHIFFTGPENRRQHVPFLIDAAMCPVSAVNVWLRDMTEDGATSSPYTWRTYAYHLMDFFTYLEDRQIRWQDISNETVLDYCAIQDQNASRHTKQYLSRKTINARILSVSRFYIFAAKNGFINVNPIRYKKIKIVRPRDSDMLTHLGGIQTLEVPSATFTRLGRSGIKWRPHDEVMRWLNSISNWQDKLIAKLLYRLGLRREEIVKLRYLDLPEPNAINGLMNEISFSIVGKGRKRRLVYIAARDFLELHDYIKIIRAKCVRRHPAKHDYIFVNNNGAPLSPGSINRFFHRISQRSGIHITPHMLRHSFAVRALQHWKAIGLSQPEKLLQARLGHSSVTTTQIYMHLTDEMQAEEALANASLIDLLLIGDVECELREQINTPDL